MQLECKCFIIKSTLTNEARMKNTTITIQLPIPLKNKAVKKAKSEGYTLAHYVRVAILEKVSGS